MDAMDTDPDVVVVEYDQVMPQKDDSDEAFEIDDDIDISEVVKDCIGKINVKRLLRLQISDATARVADAAGKCTSTNSLFETLFEQVKCVRNSLEVDDDSLPGIGDMHINRTFNESPEMHIDLQSPRIMPTSQSQSIKTYSRSINQSGDLEVIADIQVKNFNPKVPLPGPVIKPEVKIGMQVYAMKAPFFRSLVSRKSVGD